MRTDQKDFDAELQQLCERLAATPTTVTPDDVRDDER
jgi:hypothetical protein